MTPLYVDVQGRTTDSRRGSRRVPARPSDCVDARQNQEPKENDYEDDPDGGENDVFLFSHIAKTNPCPCPDSEPNPAQSRLSSAHIPPTATAEPDLERSHPGAPVFKNVPGGLRRARTVTPHEAAQYVPDWAHVVVGALSRDSEVIWRTVSHEVTTSSEVDGGGRTAVATHWIS